MNPLRDPVDLVVSGVGSTLPPRPDAVGWFDQRAELGRGYKRLPVACQYLLRATRSALSQAEGTLASVAEERRAVAVGSNHAVSAVHAMVDTATRQGEAHLISPGTAPYFSPNLLASRVAMEHALKGFSLGVHTPVTGGLEALHTAVRAVRFDHADWLVAGAAEEPPPAEDEKAVELSGTPEDGAVALVFEPASAVAARGGSALGRVRTRTFCLPPGAAGSPDGPVGRLLATALDGLGLAEPPRSGVRLIGDDCPITVALAGALGSGAAHLGSAAGCLRPVVEVADALTRPTGERLVVAASRVGNVAVAHVIPARSAWEGI